MKRAFARLALLLGTLVFCVLACEGVLRLTEHQHLTTPYRTLWPEDYFQLDSELGVDHVRDRPPTPFRFRGPTHDIFTNEHGCFDREFDGKEPYILVIGDSFAWGYAPLEDKWTTHLEHLSGKRVLKCGVSSTGPKYQTIKARKVIESVGAIPDTILMLYTPLNDFNDDAVFPGLTIVGGQRVNTLKSLDLRTGELERLAPQELSARYEEATAVEEQSALHRWVGKKSITLALLRQASRSLAEETPEQANPRAAARKSGILETRNQFPLIAVSGNNAPWLVGAFDEHLNDIRALRQETEEMGARFVVLSVNLFRTSDFHSRVADMFETEMPYFMNVGPHVREAADGRRTTWRYDPHWNRLGNRLAGEGIHRYLEENGLLGSTPNPETSRAAGPYPFHAALRDARRPGAGTDGSPVTVDCATVPADGGFHQEGNR